MNYSAKALVARAIRNGRLVRQPCEVCGAVPADAHHDDYDKPLDVRWLCRSHHKLHHAELMRRERDGGEVLLTVRISGETRDQLRALARRNERTVAGEVRIAITERLDRETPEDT